MTVEWVAQQKKVFTKWVNMHLVKKDITVQNLTEDFCDGINLCALMELLSGKPLPHKPSPKTGTQYIRVQNLNIGFSLIKEEGVKLVGIGSEDLEAKNEKMLLGLIWTLIQFYQISIKTNKGNSDTGKKQSTGSSKEVLMNWVKAHLNNVPGVVVKDFHQSWQDGAAFCALVNRAAPNSIDLNALRHGSRIDNLNLAFTVAEKQLNIPRLLDAEDIASSSKPDEQSIMTYVSLFPEVYEARGIPTPDLNAEPAPVQAPIPAPPVVVEEKKVEEEVMVVDDTNEKLEKEIEELKEMLQKAQKRMEEYRGDATASEAENASLNHTIKELQDAIFALKQHKCPDMAGVQTELKQREEELLITKEKLTQLQEKLSTLHGQNDSHIEQLQQERTMREKLQTEITTLQDLLKREAENHNASASEKEKLLKEQCDRLEREKEHEHLLLETERRDSQAELNLAGEREKALKELIAKLERDHACCFEREKALQEQLERLGKEKEHEHDLVEMMRKDSSAEYAMVLEREKLLKEQVDRLEKEREFEMQQVERVRRDSIAEMTRQSEKERELKTICEQLETEKKEAQMMVTRARRDSQAEVASMSKELLQLREELSKISEEHSQDLTQVKTRTSRSNSDAPEFNTKPYMNISLFGLGSPGRRSKRYSGSTSQPMMLIEAAKSGDLEVVTHLLESGYPVDVRDAKGNSCLHIFAEAGNAKGVTLLLTHKADPGCLDEQGNSPLHLAAKVSSVDVILALLENKANVNAKNHSGATPLFVATQHNASEAVKTLLGAKANVNYVKKENGWSPLYAACYNGNVEVAEMLVMAGAEVDAVTLKGWTPLFAAAANGHVAIVESMHTKYNANHEKLDHQMTSALFHAVLGRHQNVATYLLQHGSDVNAGREDGWRPIHAAVYNDDIQMCKLLLQYLPNLNVQCKELSLYTPLQLAIASQTPDSEIVTLLLQAGSSSNIINVNGSSALHIAAHFGHIEIVRMLVKDGARLDVKNSKGNTPVMVAANYGYKEIVEYLAQKQGVTQPKLRDRKPMFRTCASPEKVAVK